MLTRNEHLQYCKECRHQKFDVKQGLICKLTGTIADFDPVCPNFKSLSGEYGSQPLSNFENTVIFPVENMLAPKGQRLANYVLDSIILVLLFMFLSTFLGRFFGGILRMNPYLVIYLFTAFYYIVFESITGKTPAKYITNTKVVTENGLQPTILNIIGI